MSSTPSEPRTEPTSGARTASEPVDRDQATRRSRFRPFGSSTRTVSPVSHPAPTTGGVSAAEEQDPGETAPERVRHVVDRFDGAVGLLILRLVTAAILAIRGLQMLQDQDVSGDRFEQWGLPSPDVLVIVVGAVAFASAFLLIIGALVRVAGLAIAVLAVASLVYVQWRSGDVFTSGQPGFTGELELLLAAVGLTFAGLGGGGWGVDRRFRRR